MKPFALLAVFGLMASSVRVVNFDADAVGKIPPGWSVPTTNSGSPARWEILRDQTAPTQPYVLGQLSADASGGRFPLAILNSVSLRDGDVSVRLKPVAGRLDQSGGVVFRYRDPKNYYLALADFKQQSVELFKVANGQRTAIASPAKHELPSNAWRILKVSVGGSGIQVYLDHRRILRAQDKTFAAAGQVGLWTAGIR